MCRFASQRAFMGRFFFPAHAHRNQVFALFPSIPRFTLPLAHVCAALQSSDTSARLPIRPDGCKWPWRLLRLGLLDMGTFILYVFTFSMRRSLACGSPLTIFHTAGRRHEAPRLD